MLSGSKSTLAAIILAKLIAAGISDNAQALPCIGCKVPVAQANIKTVYKTRVVYHHRTVTRVRDVVRISYVVRPQAQAVRGQHVVRAPAHADHRYWDERSSRRYSWPGSGLRRLSCGSPH